MNMKNVYAKVRKQLDQQLPFAIYRKGGEELLQAFLQQDDILHVAKDYANTGFVFAPFDGSNSSILIPFAGSNYYSTKISSEKNINPNKSSENIVIKEAEQWYLDLISAAVKAIKSQAFKKVVLSRTEEYDVEETDPVSIFIKLLEKYKHAFVYLWYHPKVGMWLGATPETLLHVKGRNFFTMALAGTQPFVSDKEVVWGDKEIEEQKMVTSFILDELSSISNDVTFSETYTHKAGTLLHLRTDIKGSIEPLSFGIENIIEKLHPTPAVCGLPKAHAKSFILNKEGYDRKFYTGFLGELNMVHNGEKESNLFVNLRCMEFTKQKMVLYVGGGITKDSNPEKEWEETVRKTATMKNVLF